MTGSQTLILSSRKQQGRNNMVIGWKPTRAFIFIPFALLLFILCAVAQPHAALAAQGDAEGQATQMPAFVNGMQVTVNMKEQPEGAEDALLAHGPSVNTIYAGADLDQPQPFFPVINAIQGAGPGFNPLWHQDLITYIPPFTPQNLPLTSEAAVLAAEKAGQITVDRTGIEVYRCSVVGPGPK
jgi:hypothetical protein